MRGDDYDYKEVEQEGGDQTGQIKREVLRGGSDKHVRYYKNGKASISVKDAFPKMVHLNAYPDANPMGVTELQSNTS